VSKLVWNAVGTRFFEVGVDRGVLYVDSQPGVPWNGLTGITENASGGEAKPYYVDGVKYLNVASSEDFEATLTAFTYPKEFGVCDGTFSPRSGFILTNQRRRPFGLSYRTKIGNDVQGQDHAYKVHLVYNALATPSDKALTTMGSSSDPTEFSWKLTTKPLLIPGFAPTAHFVFDSRDIDALALGRIEELLYGTSTTSAHLPTYDELISAIDETAPFSLVDHGDGTFSVIAPSDILTVNETTGIFTLDWENADNDTADTFHIGS
jgi:hypothetical protein